MILAVARIRAAEPVIVRVHTDATDLIFRTDGQGRLCQSYLGPALADSSDIDLIASGKVDYAAHGHGSKEAFVTPGNGDFFSPALRLTHYDGNTSLRLVYASHESTMVEGGVTETSITLKDEVYPVVVNLFFKAFERENVIVSHMEISHRERKPLTLHEYASSMLRLEAERYYLAEFARDRGAREANMSGSWLNFGKKVLESTLGTRANLICSPMFAVSLDGQLCDNAGSVLIGTLAWSGNFRFTFDVDDYNRLRIVSGINPTASDYTLKAGEVFRTPEFIFTYSASGAGAATRSMHDWARNYRINDGRGDRMTLLNNWEATYFNFDEDKLAAIIADAAKLGVDMFLLDDGWFGSKYPRNDASQGLGDWTPIPQKLPGGIAGWSRRPKATGLNSDCG